MAYAACKGVYTYTGLNGVIGSRTEGLSSRIDTLSDQRVRIERRLQSVEARLIKQYSTLDGLMASMQSTNAFLQQQLLNLPTIGSNER